MLYIFDRHEVLLEIITDYSEFDFKDKLQTSSIFSFSTSKKNNIKKGNKVGFFRKEKFQLFLIDDFTEHTYIDESQISVVTISDYNILGNSIIEDKRVINGTLREAAEKALEGSEYKVGVVEEFENKNINFYFVSRLKALNDIVNTFNCEIDVRIEIDDSTGKIINKYIDFKHRLGKDTGLRFTFDTNLEAIEKSPIGDHFNVLYGRGKSLETDSGGYSRKLDFAEINNGKKYVEDLESIKKYGRLEGIYEDGNIEDKQLLLSKTLEKLEEIKNPKFTYKVSLKNLMAFDKFEHYQCEKGDTIFILDEEDDLVLEARVVEISEEDNEVILTLSNIETGLMGEDIESEIGNIKDKIDIIENKKPTIDTIYPDTLPDVPILTAKALYASVILDWTYSNKDYYTYELFASQIKNFNPTSDNRIFEGKASSFLHEVRPSQTWYYRARAKNTYGNTTLFSNQIEVTTRKISDSAEIFEEAAIGHAIIKDLDMDKATVGKLKGQRIDARNLTVTDGNGKRTLDIDSYGNVNLDVNSLNIRGSKVVSEKDTLINIKTEINKYKTTVDSAFKDVNAAHENLIEEMNGAFKDGILTEAEKQNLKDQLANLEAEKDTLIKEIDKLIKSKYLQNTNQLIELIDAKKEYIYRFYVLINAIRETIGEPPLEIPNIPGLTIERDLIMHFPHFSNKFNPAYPDISLIEDYEGSVYLFDGGEKTNQYEVEKYLKNRNINKVDKIFITHSHSDHIESMPYLIEKFGCKELYLRTPKWDSLDHWETVWKTRELHEAMVAKATEVGARIIEINDDITIPLNNRSNIKVFNSKNTAWGNYNNISLGYLFNFTSKNGTIKKLFIQGDMSYQAEEFVGGQNVGKVDLLKLGHHGNVSSNGETWLSHLRPTYSIATLGYPQGNQVKLNTMRAKFVSSKVFLPNDNPDHMSVVINKDDGTITTTAIEHQFYCEWYQRDNGDWYYFKSNGNWAINESLVIGGLKYYFDSNGLCTNPGGETIG
ncbi:phage tail protein [Clostridium perfringens]|uniref:phage tail protein n=1 Tax=Clostridium perfringens TaxID=1502 RepID=UPI001CCF1B61|nr:phage tail protein [Clostridium perfringens]UBK76263.1 phage tail protein [Clostridium perfringens]